jgi:outer membrane protein OmpA-like peptidoglycan-associated protein
VEEHLKLTLGLAGSHSRKALSTSMTADEGTGSAATAVVDHRVDFDFMASLGLLDVAEIAVAMPVAFQTGDDGSVFGDGVAHGDANAISQGDLRLIPKLQLADVSDGAFAAALLSSVVIPSGDGTQYIGESGVVFSPALALSARLGRFRSGLEAGYRVRPQSIISSLVVDDEVFGSLAAAYNFGPSTDLPVDIVAELHGHLPAKAKVRGVGFDTREYTKIRTTAELDVGIRSTFARGLQATLGVGTGVLPGYGAPETRIFASISYQVSLASTELEPDAPTVVARTEEAANGRGNVSEEVGAAVLAEATTEKTAPPVLELQGRRRGADIDRRATPQTGLCAYLPANEQDPLPSAGSDSLRDPSARDSDTNRTDEDGDGVSDDVDWCPNEAESYNNFRDTDGCPERGVGPESVVRVSRDRIEVRQKISFQSDTDVLASRSQRVLKQVASVMRNYQGISRLQIAVHTVLSTPNIDDTTLSQARAEAIARYLVEQGVAPSRLRPVGYGASKPLVPVELPDAWRVNNRVEFTIASRHDATSPHTD